MSGLIALIDLERRPVARQLMSRCVEVSAHRGPPGSATPLPWVHLSALGSHAQVMTNRRFALLVHGRASLLGSPSARPTIDDLLQSCERDGLQALDDLDGEVAWIGVDLRSGEVRFARDRSGIKPLMKRVSGTLLGFASEPAPLLEIGPRPAPNEGMIAEYLSGAPQHRSETLWQGIERVNPLAVGAISSAGHMTISPSRRIELASPSRSDAEWLEALRATMTAAVTDRIDADGITAVELSGGFDSTTNLAIAASTSEHERLLAVVRDYTGTPTEETAYWQAALRRYPVPSLITPAQESHAGWMLTDARLTGDRPVVPHLGAWRTELSAIRRHGVRVTLSGQGGDERLGHSYRLPQQRLLHGDLVGAYQAVRHHAGVEAPRAIARRLFSAAAAGLVGPRGPDSGSRSWLTADLRRRVHLQERIMPRRHGAPTPVQNELIEWATGEIPHQYLEAAERTASAHGLELRHPFFDWRVIELCCQMPERLRTTPTDPRAAHRHAFADVLPRAVTERRDKADFTEPYRASVIDEAIFDDPTRASVVTNGWVDERWLCGAVERTRAGALGSAALLTIVASVEAWARVWVDE